MPEQLQFWEDPRWIITTIFALWGAALSTYQLISRLRERRPGVTVSLSFGSAGDGLYFIVGIRNVGMIDVFLKASCCMFEVKDAGFSIGTTSTAAFVPTILKPGDSTHLQVPFTDVLKSVNGSRKFDKFNIRALVSDAIGRQTGSEWVEMTDHSAIFGGTIVQWNTPEHPLTDEQGRSITMSATNKKTDWSWRRK